MASHQNEMTLHDFLTILRNRGISRFQFDPSASTDSENNTNPDQDSSNGSDPDDSNQTEMTFDDDMNDSRTDSEPVIEESADTQTNTDPDQDSSERSDPRDRLIIMNPLSRRVLVIEGSASGVNALVRDLMTPDGPPPASKASIEAMPSVETKEDDECVICLDEFVGQLAKEMPCKHKFHGGCVEKWLKINESCPVCRYKMPVDDENEFSFKNLFESEEGRGRQLWVSVGTLVEDPNQMATNDSHGHDDSEN
ncbi:R-mandelonitrile lyase-like [Heracleum sosnowskyi]|uniref:RING-type E3 ubiquitin transferase n=1 Tax=Heracleum sosnowskyi TaxID=360622 RepID=A0AAD8I100_9APIA|nr:R-mandelonitrile lyase-like [Heracleum sosnowskyi]